MTCSIYVIVLRTADMLPPVCLSRAAKEAEEQLEYIYRSQYLPEQGMFAQLPADLQLGTWLPAPKACRDPGPWCWSTRVYAAKALLLKDFDGKCLMGKTVSN